MKKWLVIALSVCMLLSLCAAAEMTPDPTLAADGAHILALDAEGNVWAWGSNHRGESDPESAETRVLMPVKVLENVRAVACGRRFSLALTKENELLAWGDNASGQIPGFEGDCAREFVKVEEGVKAIAACESRGAFVTERGVACVWGDGQAMTAVMERAESVAVGADFTLVLTESGEVYTITDAEPVKTLENCAAIYASGQSAYALTREGTLLAWGANGTEGRLGLSAGTWVSEPTAISLSGVVRVAPGLTAAAALTESGELYVWGTVYSFVTHFDEAGAPVGSLVEAELVHYGAAPIPLYEAATDAAFGDAFVAVRLPGGAICTWGSNDQGQIGNGTFTETACRAGEDGEEEMEIVIVSNEQCIFPACLRLGA